MEPLLLEAIRIKHSDTYKAIMTHCPPSLLSKFNPATAGFVDLQQVRDPSKALLFIMSERF